MVRDAKEMLSAMFEKYGLEYICNEGNYLMVRVPSSDTLIYRKLMREGVMVRTMTGFRFPNWIRVSLVQLPVMEDFCTAFQKIVD